MCCRQFQFHWSINQSSLAPLGKEKMKTKGQSQLPVESRNEKVTFKIQPPPPQRTVIQWQLVMSMTVTVIMGIVMWAATVMQDIVNQSTNSSSTAVMRILVSVMMMLRLRRDVNDLRRRCVAVVVAVIMAVHEDGGRGTTGGIARHAAGRIWSGRVPGRRLLPRHSCSQELGKNVKKMIKKRLLEIFPDETKSQNKWR